MLKLIAFTLALHALAVGQGSTAPVDLSRQQWNGPAICYSGYRVGQDPDKRIFPTKPQVLEDLRLLQRQWRLIRLYGSDQHAQDVLETIRKHRIPIKVMLGVWLNGKPEKQGDNREQVAGSIRLANRYPSIVAAVNVGNEALVSWSDHRMSEDALLEIVKKVKAAVKCKVTVADDFLYWVQPGNRLVEHLDFITLHSYPIWARLEFEQAVAATIERYEQVRRCYPGKTIVFGEVGWASYTDANPLHLPGAGSEARQKRYYEEMNAWARGNGVTTFLFEAFDEPWKGAGTEGHWGVFTVDRKAKPVVRDLFPDRLPTAPTSPRSEVAPADTAKPVRD